MVYFATASPEGGFVSAAETLAGRSLRTVEQGDWDPRSLKVNCYVRDQDGQDTRIVIHAVNYNAKLHRTDVDPPIPLSDLRFNLRLPEGMDAEAVVAYDPAANGPRALDFVQDARALSFTLPRIEVYAAIAVD